MANRQTYVIGALGVLVGMVVGASSAQNAQTVSFAGNDPNSEIIRNMPTFRRADGIVRQRSTEQALGSAFMDSPYRLTAPRRASLEQSVDQRRTVRASQQSGTTYGSAEETGTIRGMPAKRRARVAECADYSGNRYTNCLEAFINGEVFMPNYFEADYE